MMFCQPRRSGRTGFTFFEVVMVVALIGMLTIFVTAGMTVHASVTVEAEILRSYLGYAQSLAMANNVADWRISFGAQDYTLERDDGSGWAAAPVNWPGENSVTHALPAGLSLSIAGGEVVEFDDWGAPDATHTFTVSDGSEMKQVVIREFTGLVL